MCCLSTVDLLCNQLNVQYSAHSVNAAKQMCFESVFECGYCWSTSDLFWKLVPAMGGIRAKSRLALL